MVLHNPLVKKRKEGPGVLVRLTVDCHRQRNPQIETFKLSHFVGEVSARVSSRVNVTEMPSFPQIGKLPLSRLGRIAWVGRLRAGPQLARKYIELLAQRHDVQALIMAGSSVLTLGEMCGSANTR